VLSAKKSARTMKNKTLIKALGNAAREVYLAENPHGFRKLNKVHKSKKKYSRKSKNNY
jgi:hypothetical protein